MAGRTISISNIGSIGGGWFTLLSTNGMLLFLVLVELTEDHTLADGEIVGRMMKLSLTHDHRLVMVDLHNMH